MIYLFSGTGQKALASFLSRPTLCAFDFDGTLAPIVRKPADARMPPHTTRLLKTLATKNPVAVLSGRSLRDLRQRLPAPLLLVGNHGAEGSKSGKREQKNAAQEVRQWLASLELPKDIEVENKTYSLSLHYRHSAATSRRSIPHAIAKLHPTPRLIAGKSVVNLLPPRLPNKGEALIELLETYPQALFLGDDQTDEDVFRLQEPRLFSVRVGRKRLSHARYFLQSRGEINRLLRQLISRLVSTGEGVYPSPHESDWHRSRRHQDCRCRSEPERKNSRRKMA